MEDSSTTDATLRAYRALRHAGADNVGIVLQAALRRTLADARELGPLRPRVRVVKGIWVEPYAVAYQDFWTVRHNFVAVLERLLEAGCYVEIATHDEWLVASALALLDRFGRGPESYEFQLLLGVREELGDVLVRDGHRVRVYVPYGEQWWEYCLRRLKENPSLARHVLAHPVRALRQAVST
jgi:proline dehydrogenase